MGSVVLRVAAALVEGSAWGVFTGRGSDLKAAMVGGVCCACFTLGVSRTIGVHFLDALLCKFTSSYTHSCLVRHRPLRLLFFINLDG